MSAVESRLAATLAKHYGVAREVTFGPVPWRCSCGASLGDSDDPSTEHIAHVAAVIAGSDDLAVIELPKPDDDAEYGKVWRYDDVLGTVQVRPDGSIESRGDYEYEHTADEMRRAAGVAAAAAKAAEAVSDR